MIALHLPLSVYRAMPVAGISASGKILRPTSAICDRIRVHVFLHSVVELVPECIKLGSLDEQ
jgi:hypothetical protein